MISSEGLDIIAVIILCTVYTVVKDINRQGTLLNFNGNWTIAQV